jgi:hypothetical protein
MTDTFSTEHAPAQSKNAQIRSNLQILTLLLEPPTHLLLKEWWPKDRVQEVASVLPIGTSNTGPGWSIITATKRHAHLTLQSVGRRILRKGKLSPGNMLLRKYYVTPTGQWDSIDMNQYARLHSHRLIPISLEENQ